MCQFSVEILRLHWIKDAADDPEDLCLHGDVAVTIGGERMAESVTVSAGAMMLLRTMTEGHSLGEVLQIMPCCGHAMYAEEGGQRVQIIGCAYGIDWSVRHEGDTVWLETKAGTVACIPQTEYRAAAFAFADRIWAHYMVCTPKKLPDDLYDREGYLAFWREWHRLRGTPFALPVRGGKRGE